MHNFYEDGNSREEIECLKNTIQDLESTLGISLDSIDKHKKYIKEILPYAESWFTHSSHGQPWHGEHYKIWAKIKNLL